MKVKQKAKRVVSGLLTAVTLLSTVLSPISSYAAELPKERKLPLLEEVQSQLDEDEIVLAKDHQVEVGTVFDVKKDFSGLEIRDQTKVKITFEEAKNEKGEDFSTSHADTYKTIYSVEPVNQEHPNYQISRNVIVKEVDKEKKNSSTDVEQSETKESDDDEADSEKPSEIPTEIPDVSEENAAFDALIEETMDQETYDEVSGLELHDVMEQAVEQGVDFNGMETGEVTTFKAMARTAGVGSQYVTVEKGPLYRYADFGLGTYVTEPYYISYGNVRATAYCVQPAKPGPPSGTYTITKLADNQALAKDTLVTTITTGESGKAVAKDLPLGRYYVVETKAPEGFVLNPEPVKVALTYQDQDTPIVEAEAIVGNDRQKVSISVEKQDAENGQVLSGAVFGIYNKKDIQANGKVLVKADTLLQEMTSDENGMATCTLDLPFGEYYVKELKAPEGFVSSDEVLEFVAEYQGQETKIVSLQAVKKNEPTTAEFTKSDLTTGVELEGARLKVMDKDGNVIDEWTSEKDKPHVIKRLVVGETYTLHEEFAPYGYLKATDVTFTVKDTAEVQKVEMKDEAPKGLLIINKKGEFLEKITLLDNVKGTVEHFFEYITGNLSEVTFEVYVAEDIKAADGVSADHYKKDELVGTITTDEKGIAKMEDLPVGKYYVKEVKTAHGFVLDGEPRFVDLTYRDQDTPVVTFDEEWQNNRQKIKVTVLKKEKDTERMLEGAIFGLFTKEDIKGRDGKVLMEAGTLIEQKTTDENGQILFKADLPVDGTYIVKEIYAPDGFVTSNEEKEFTFEYGKPEEAEVSYEFVFENEPTTVELTKTDLTTGKELPGAHLKVTDEDGNVIDEWVSTEKAHVIKELTVGKSYMMTETKPADGYVTAESITFTVENTAEIQKQEMKDDVTKVLISKQDIAGKELPGAKLTILDEDGNVVESWTSTEEAHYIEMLPIGKYTLREETAPEGYLVAKDVEFEVKDTAEVQKVVMVDEEKPKESTPEGGKPSKDAPKTGDNTNLLLWLIVLGMSLSGVVVLGRKIKKK